MNTIKKRPLLRKLLVLSILAIAGIGIGEVYQYFSKQTVEEVLVHYQAKTLMTSTMRINGVDVIGKTWQLPAVVSPSVLKDAKGRALVVPQGDKGHLIYTFDQMVVPDSHGTFYPQALPRIDGFECQYVIDMTNTRTVIMGNAKFFAKDMQQRVDVALRGTGWTYQPATLSWTKASSTVQTLFTSRDNGCSGILLLETR